MPDRTTLPQLTGGRFLTDGGIETTLIFDDGLELEHFAAFPLLGSAAGRAALLRYYDSYLALARRDRRGIVLDTPTWRASAEWGARLGFGPAELDAVNRDAVALLVERRRRYRTAGGDDAGPVVISGCVGPRGDGYRPDSAMTAEQARAYHAPQLASFADTAADLATALTLTTVEEAVGIALAAGDVDLPVAIGFTVETDGRLASGVELGRAIGTVDERTDAGPAYYLVNCAHPTHLLPVLDAGAGWTGRLQGIRANASRLSHAELDEADDLDRGDPTELARLYRELDAALPALAVVGGCCGTDARHVGAISRALP